MTAWAPKYEKARQSLPFKWLHPQDFIGGTKSMLKPWFHSWLTVWSFTGYTDLRIYISTSPDFFFSCVFLHTLWICSTSSSSFKTTSLGPLPLLLLKAASASSSFVPHWNASVQPEVGSCREAGKWALSAPPGLSIWWVQRSKERRNHKLDTNLSQDLCEELTSKLGVHGKSLHFCPPPRPVSQCWGFLCPSFGDLSMLWEWVLWTACIWISGAWWWSQIIMLIKEFLKVSLLYITTWIRHHSGEPWKMHENLLVGRFANSCLLQTFASFGAFHCGHNHRYEKDQRDLSSSIWYHPINTGYPNITCRVRVFSS